MPDGNSSRLENSDGSHPVMAVLSATIVMVLVLSACAARPQTGNLDSEFGNAVRQNMAIQVINPNAAGADESHRIDGQSAERALEAQRTRSTEATIESAIINVGGGGSGSR